MPDKDPKEAIKATAEITALLIQQLDTDKVAKVIGKNLSEKDFTTDLFNKLTSITGINTGDQEANKVPVSAINGIVSSNVQDVLTELRSQISEVVSDKFFTHSQGISANVWICNHGLGKIPSVSIVDSAGTEVEGLVKHSFDFMVTTLYFSAPFSGYAYLN